MAKGNKFGLLLFGLISIGLLSVFSSCKSCHKGSESGQVKTDSTAATTAPANTINLPHADTSLIPVFSKILDSAFAASAKKDYKTLGTFIVYMGPDSSRFGADVYNTKKNYELNVVRITADVFNRWNSGIDSRDYSRVFEYKQPGAMDMQVMEVLFVSRKKIDRKFFGFMQIRGSYKIADITSAL
jgi:hypothetical protein